MGHLFLILNVVVTVACQVVLKWRLNELRLDFSQMALFKSNMVAIFSDLWILASVAGTLGASLLWILALTKVDLSYAFPFSTISYVGILAISHFFLNEQLNAWRITGVIVICIGIVILSFKS